MKYLILILSLFSINSYAETYKVGIVPQFEQTILKQKWLPLLHYLGNTTNNVFLFKPANNMQDFETNLYSGYYDLVYINPMQYIKIRKLHGYKVILSVINERLKGIVVVNNSLDIKDVHELNNKEMAFPYPSGFGAYIVINDYLEKENINVIPVFVGSHQKVYDSVSRGLFIAGGGIIQTFNDATLDTRNKLKILYTSPDMAAVALVASPKIDNNELEKIINVLLSLNETEKTQIYLDILNIKGFEIIKDSEYDKIRKMDIIK